MICLSEQQIAAKQLVEIAVADADFEELYLLARDEYGKEEVAFLATIARRADWPKGATKLWDAMSEPVDHLEEVLPFIERLKTIGSSCSPSETEIPKHMLQSYGHDAERTISDMASEKAQFRYVDSETLNAVRALYKMKAMTLASNALYERYSNTKNLITGRI